MWGGCPSYEYAELTIRNWKEGEGFDGTSEEFNTNAEDNEMPDVEGFTIRSPVPVES